MSSKKSNIEKSNCDDLSFMPLNIDSSLAPNSSKFPLPFDMNAISMCQSMGAVSLGFPNLNINPNPMPLTINTMPELAPLTPYPKNIPAIEPNAQLNQNTNIPNTNTNTNTNINTPNSNLSPNNNASALEYPTEPDDSFLYSYNESNINERYAEGDINAVDILRNFDISLDFIELDSRKKNCSEEEVNEIFSLIEKDNPGILATMKAYRIPYPIAKLLIKKIIKISIDNCKR